VADVVKAGFSFRPACEIAVRRRTDGEIETDTPHLRSPLRKGGRLLKGGEGPFCKFNCPSGLKDAGVYLICCDDHVCYVGQSGTGLSQRFGSPGYGSIQPRNCYQGGQSTNIWINANVLQASIANREISVWFLPSQGLDEVEKAIKSRFSPPWNRG